MPTNPFLAADSTHVIRGGLNEALQTRKLGSLVKPPRKSLFERGVSIRGFELLFVLMKGAIARPLRSTCFVTR
jgi:hypothetical protein